jgi:hypothetical protein
MENNKEKRCIHKRLHKDDERFKKGFKHKKKLRDK